MKSSALLASALILLVTEAHSDVRLQCESAAFSNLPVSIEDARNIVSDSSTFEVGEKPVFTRAIGLGCKMEDYSLPKEERLLGEGSVATMYLIGDNSANGFGGLSGVPGTNFPVPRSARIIVLWATDIPLEKSRDAQAMWRSAAFTRYAGEADGSSLYNVEIEGLGAVQYEFSFEDEGANPNVVWGGEQLTFPIDPSSGDEVAVRRICSGGVGDKVQISTKILPGPLADRIPFSQNAAFAKKVAGSSISTDCFTYSALK